MTVMLYITTVQVTRVMFCDLKLLVCLQCFNAVGWVAGRASDV